MDKFNPCILLVMRWLQNPDLVSVKELEANAYEAAYTAVEAAVDAAYISAKYAHAAVAYDDYAHASESKKYLNEYFETTKEDRTAYENRVKYLNILN